MNIKNVIGDYEQFLQKIFYNLKNVGIDLNDLKELDHIAYRTEDLKTYNKTKRQLIPFCEKYNDKEFNGRRIFVCRFKEPLEYEDFRIEGLELLAPKMDNKFTNGLEHAEFVLSCTLEELLKKHPDIIFNMSAYNREENPELIIDFEDCAVKFHKVSLLHTRNL